MSGQYEIQFSSGRQTQSAAIGQTLAVLFCPSSNGKVFGVTVDKEDLPRLLSAGKWSVSNFDSRGGVKLYAHLTTRTEGRTIYMHRFVLELTDPKIEADHIYGRTLDNRKSQIRAASKSLNQRNKKRTGPDNRFGHRGVMARPSGRFAARVFINHRPKWLGTFDTPEQAGQAVIDFNRQLGVIA